MMVGESLLRGNAETLSRQVWVEGKSFEIWENPEAPFEGSAADLKAYAARGRWDLVFNALVLGATSE